ncbi:lysine-rich nucleolar protein 1 isoform X2 [Tachysurus fulvidraco]|uniref:lysine-rich nucleolar protein 1 isoform X2 n=1 Tax=Tachysurus fulvidraco TaxID=1234273 RepID=UPI001FEE3E06|nr:lysine-rich nucleolar protein 1 isoform X2 [Tachysurus fulvidraco]
MLKISLRLLLLRRKSIEALPDYFRVVQREIREKEMKEGGIETRDVGVPEKDRKKKTKKAKEEKESQGGIETRHEGVLGKKGKKKLKKEEREEELEEDEAEECLRDESANVKQKKKKKNKKMEGEDGAGEKKKRKVKEDEEDEETEDVCEEKESKKKKSERNSESSSGSIREETAEKSEKRKRKKEKRESGGEGDETTEIELNIETERKKKKKQSGASDERETNAAPGEEQQEEEEDGGEKMRKKKKKRKGKGDEMEEERETEEDVQTSALEKDQEPQSNSSYGQWDTAQFDSSERQLKFLRLMGGLKKGGQAAGQSGGRFNMALGTEGQQNLQQGLLGEFERAQNRRMDFQNRGAGLGFSASSDKKFHIDINARSENSTRFDE